MSRSAVLRSQGRTALLALDRRAVFFAPRLPNQVNRLAQTALISKPLSVRHRLFSTSHPFSEQDQGSQSIGQIDPKLSLTFTCTVQDCGHRSTHEFTKRSYEKGIVLVQVSSYMKQSNKKLILLSRFSARAVETGQSYILIHHV